MSSTEISFRAVNEFPEREKIEFGELLGVSLGSNTTPFTHGLHRFPAKFIPQVPRWAIRQVRERRPLILDPFMGSGTSILEGLLFDCVSVGLDIDPLATLITTVKTNKYDGARLRELGLKICARQGKKAASLILPMAAVEKVHHWFSPSTFSELCLIFETINLISCTLAERQFFWCIFSSILRLVSNADDQTQKTYVSHTLQKHPPKAWQTFKKQLARALERVEELSHIRRGEAHILRGTATTLPIRDNTVDLIVSSPPYLDSVDYMYNLMLEYFWLGPALGVFDRKQFNQLRRAPIGAKSPHNGSQLPGHIRSLVNLEVIPSYRRKAASSYFALMDAHFAEAARVLKNEARYVLVIGNSSTIADT
jgi:adenine-specific DNA methylase